VIIDEAQQSIELSKAPGYRTLVASIDRLSQSFQAGEWNTGFDLSVRIFQRIAFAHFDVPLANSAGSGLAHEIAKALI
jgi:hypothetical protein